MLGASTARADSDHQAYGWRNVQIVAGGFITGIQFHPTEPGLVYVRTDIGGSYRWDEGFGRWLPLNDATSRIYGRVYLGTNGRGVLYGDP